MKPLKVSLDYADRSDFAYFDRIRILLNETRLERGYDSDKYHFHLGILLGRGYDFKVVIL
jgi:hypothetical protein